MARWHIVFSGRVQHVGFRTTALCLARGLSLTGWVDNRPDGTVEMEAQGGAGQLRGLVMRLKRQPHHRIARVDIREIDILPDERKFRIGRG